MHTNSYGAGSENSAFIWYLYTTVTIITYYHYLILLHSEAASKAIQKKYLVSAFPTDLKI